MGVGTPRSDVAGAMRGGDVSGRRRLRAPRHAPGTLVTLTLVTLRARLVTLRVRFDDEPTLPAPCSTLYPPAPAPPYLTPPPHHHPKVYSIFFH